ncbi:glycosyltransferase family 2 protein [Paractinoplanes lichenicola]|uniref:4,4'-diaponeurosporenoate glycosyltransferase n=1 Tax=Paractinoplanes lichenicola TaxID=2802976 RepID=A0ABS1VI87_9ACTN|nr:glycosyltransferase family A protein [Actinoplanes lichenicola]MBL7254425.1 glycosyltransferase family 2 protein [Actinoplanes lichenicola]
MSTPLWVIVPAYNEAARIGATLDALAAQTDTDFTLLVVDNGSTDETAAIARQFHGPFPSYVVVEREKGVGCAVDTGFRHAIAAGAVHLARTDADCLPAPGWVAAARAALHESSGLACGRITARRDEHGPFGRAFFRTLVVLAASFGRIRPAHRGPEFKAPYRMHAGNNMAITAELYEACGGMPRRPSPTDRTFLNRVRRTTPAIVHSRHMVVANSTRRIKAYGVVGTAKWYLDRGSGVRTADPR